MVLTLYDYTGEFVFYGALDDFTEHPHGAHHVQSRLWEHQQHSVKDKQY